MLLAVLAGAARVRAQAALLMEEPFGVVGALNPTGHDALYFARICAETPVKLRRCAPGEAGVVLARYNKVAGYDWLAIPVIPYFYAVEKADQVPADTDAKTVTAMRRAYVAAHVLKQVGFDQEEPDQTDAARRTRRHGEDWYRQDYWYQLTGSVYDRRVYAFRFSTSAAQDDALIACLNAAPNRSHFSLIRNNCADFAAFLLDFYFPHTFYRRLLPDAGITTPRQNAWELERYARRHGEFRVSVDEIPQIPGNRRPSQGNMSVAASLLATGDVLAVAALNPYVAGAVGVDFLLWGRYPLPLKHPEVLGPASVAALADAPGAGESAADQARREDFSADN
jgi:hypothetical protein